MSDDETRAADALAALQQLDAARIEYKSDVGSAVLDVVTRNREVTTLFSVDNLDTVGDITEVTAFKRSIDHRGDRIPHLFMHDLNAPAIARIMSFQALRRAELPTDVQQTYPEATGGMACVSRYLKSGRGAEVFEGIEDGIPYQASFGYKTINAVRESLKDGRKARRIKELAFYEVSTTLPSHAANDATRTRLGKALQVLEEMKAGWRHGRHDDLAILNQIVQLCASLGADLSLPEPAPLPAARTSEVDDILAQLDAVLEV
jgi:phage head maturation protease